MGVPVAPGGAPSDTPQGLGPMVGGCWVLLAAPTRGGLSLGGPSVFLWVGHWWPHVTAMSAGSWWGGNGATKSSMATCRGEALPKSSLACGGRVPMDGHGDRIVTGHMKEQWGHVLPPLGTHARPALCFRAMTPSRDTTPRAAAAGDVTAATSLGCRAGAGVVWWGCAVAWPPSVAPMTTPRGRCPWSAVPHAAVPGPALAAPVGRGSAGTGDQGSLGTWWLWVAAGDHGALWPPQW